MTDTEIITEIARLDGWKSKPIQREVFQSPTETETYTVGWTQPPAYLTSRDAIVPVIEKLWDASGIDSEFRHWFMQNKLTIFATPRQICIALLKATGKHKE